MAKGSPTYSSRLALLSFFGAALSTWLLYHHIEVNGGYQMGDSFCDISELFSCSSVAKSPYAEFFKVPVAGFAVLYYIALLLFLMFLRPAKESSRQNFASAFLVLVLIGLVPTLVMAAISVFLIGAICSMCACLYLVQMLLLVVALRNPDLGQWRGKLFEQCRQDVLEIVPGRALVVSLVLLLLAVLIVKSPSLLVENYFEPRRERLHAEESLLPIYQKWLAAPYFEALEQVRVEGLGRDYTKGAPDAPLVLIEFSDFECPFCARAAKVLKKINQEMPDSVRIVFKNYPLDASCNPAMPAGHGHQNACRAAKMSRCAGEQDTEKFWQMHDAIFELGTWSESVVELLPTELGLDTDAFSKCMESESTNKRIQEDIELGNLAEIKGTPTFFLNGRRLDISNLPALEPFLKYAAKQSRKR